MSLWRRQHLGYQGYDAAYVAFELRPAYNTFPHLKALSISALRIQLSARCLVAGRISCGWSSLLEQTIPKLTICMLTADTSTCMAKTAQVPRWRMDSFHFGGCLKSINSGSVCSAAVGHLLT